MSSSAGHRAGRTSPLALPILIVLAFAVLVAATRVSGPSSSAECRASFDPGRVVITETRISVNARFSESMRKIRGVNAQAGSGIGSIRYEADRSALTMNTSAGNPGSWSIEFIDEGGQKCVGTLALAQAEQD